MCINLQIYLFVLQVAAVHHTGMWKVAAAAVAKVTDLCKEVDLLAIHLCWMANKILVLLLSPSSFVGAQVWVDICVVFY